MTSYCGSTIGCARNIHAAACSRKAALFLTSLIWQVVGAARENESDRPLLRHDFILPPRFEFEGNHSLMPTMTPGGELSE